MAAQDGNLNLCGNIPDTGGHVEGAGDQPATISAERGAAYTVLMGQYRDFFARF